MILIISRATLEKNAWTYFWENKLLFFIKYLSAKWIFVWYTLLQAFCNVVRENAS